MQEQFFDSFNARFVQPSQIARHFVLPPNFAQICERNHAVLIGPRGSGKTTLLKMLQVGALQNWSSADHQEFIRSIDYTSIYVAADSSWSSLFESTPELPLSPEWADLIAQALFNLFLQFALVDTLEDISNDELLGDSELKRFHLPRKDIEEQIAAALAKGWWISGAAPSYFVLRSKLSQRLNEIALISDTVRYGKDVQISEQIELHPFLSLRYDFLLKNSVDSINSISGNRDRRWCLCLDELEIVPLRLRRLMFRNLRSSDQRILFKMSLSPFSIDMPGHGDSTSPMPGQDYTEIYLSYPRSGDAIRFGDQLVKSLLTETGIEDQKPIDIFGRSGTAAIDPNVHTGPPSSYAAPHGDRFKLFDNLQERDPSFRHYLRVRDYDIANMPRMPENKRAELRKLLQICRARIEFRQARQGRRGQQLGYRRSRKRIHEMYTGYDALLTICEGNPRWIIGMLRPQIQRYKRLTSHGNRGHLPFAYQARQLLKVIVKYRALLGTIPLKGKKSARASALQLIDAIGNYMFSDVVLGEFKPEPALSFIVDRKVTPEQIEAIGTAVNQGAFVLVPNRKGDSTAGTVVGSRFRLSYLLAPDFQLPLTYGAQINLSSILSSSDTVSQLRLEDYEA